VGWTQHERQKGLRATTPGGLYLRQRTGVGEETGLPRTTIRMVKSKTIPYLRENGRTSIVC
jgi:hypothetical protein